MLLRRLVFAALTSITAALLLALMVRVLAPGGWTPLKALILAGFVLHVPWVGLCAANALCGFTLRLGSRDPPRAVLPAGADFDRVSLTLATAIAVTIRHEDMGLVLPPLRCLLDGLDAAGAGDRFSLFVLSDSTDPALAAAEVAAVAAFRAADPAPARVRYRRRADPTGFKAGNVMDFLDHHAEGFDLALMLDADSEMTAAAALRLVRIMHAAPGLGIVQHLTAGRPAEAAFARLFQFGMRAGMRLWAIGQAWWQGDCGPYWGHNAVLRVAPFRAHARLRPLPDGSPILSHDQVEAAQLRAAGWGVAVWADDAGSLESHPPALPEFLRRECRWLAGNLQYRHLLRAPGLRPMGRWQLAQAMLLFSGAPLSTLMLGAAALNAALGDGAACPRGRLLALALAWPLALYSPKLLGYLELLVRPALRGRYGGGLRVAAGAAAEIAFTLLLDAPAQVSKSLTLARLLAGGTAGWPAQNRRDRRVGWAEAARLFWPHTAFGIAVFALLLAGSPGAAFWALPFAGGLLVTLPFSVLTASPGLSAWLGRRGVAAMPEELGRFSRRPRRRQSPRTSAAAIPRARAPLPRTIHSPVDAPAPRRSRPAPPPTAPADR